MREMAVANGIPEKWADIHREGKFYPMAAYKALIAFQSDYWTKLSPKDFGQINEYESATLHAIKKYMGETMLNAMLNKIVADIASLFSVGRGMNDMQKEMLVEVIKDEYMAYTLTDFRLFMKMLVKGTLGSTYDRFDAPTFMEMLGKYDYEKMVYFEMHGSDPDKKQVKLDDIIQKLDGQKLLASPDSPGFDLKRAIEGAIAKFEERKLNEILKEDTRFTYHSLDSYFKDIVRQKLKPSVDHNWAEEQQDVAYAAIEKEATKFAKQEIEKLEAQFKQDAKINDVKPKYLNDYIGSRKAQWLVELNKSNEKGSPKTNDQSSDQKPSSRNGKEKISQNTARKGHPQKAN